MTRRERLQKEKDFSKTILSDQIVNSIVFAAGNVRKATFSISRQAFFTTRGTYSLMSSDIRYDWTLRQ